MILWGGGGNALIVSSQSPLRGGHLPPLQAQLHLPVSGQEAQTGGTDFVTEDQYLETRLSPVTQHICSAHSNQAGGRLVDNPPLLDLSAAVGCAL